MYIHANYDLINNNTFHFSAKARYFVEVRYASDISVMRRDPMLSALPWMIIGGGSNILLKDDLDAVLLKCVYDQIKVVKEDKDSVWLSVGAGCNWHDLVTYTVNQGWWGLENLALIPGTVGAAPVQNIGAYGAEVQDTITRIQSIDLRNGQRIELRRSECQFGYRDSIFKHDLANRVLIHRATFRLRKQSQANLMHEPLHDYLLAKTSIEKLTPRCVYDAVIHLRNQRIPDPAVLGSAGSFFKNPHINAEHFQHLQEAYPSIPHHKLTDGHYKVPAAWLIEQCGWKGKRLQNAGVYEKHALILVNYGNATADEVLALADKICEDVIERFAISLEKEVVLMGTSKDLKGRRSSLCRTSL